MLEANHFDEFTNEIGKSKNIHFYAICESWLRQGTHSNKIINIEGFNLFRSDRQSRPTDHGKGGGVLIYVRKNIKSKFITRSSDHDHDIKNAEFLFMEVTTKFFKICVAIIYRTNGCNSTDTGKLFDLIINTRRNIPMF